jgi:hypothetical protein
VSEKVPRNERREGYCSQCKEWTYTSPCPKCGLPVMPTTVEKRLMDRAKKIDEDMLRQFVKIRHDVHAPSRSFIGELYMALVDSYNLGIKMKGELRKKVVATVSNCEKEKV